ncbi:phosphate ABC transporter substrate-binding protein PstS [Desertifilum sp. FACHB-1129]|uniref:Phosphate-binding protein n=2 Tax=Desertifilum tharense IPPAS B-1220 TaxID=1781255 RepID=A0A1E5QN48_9CYAN|nr:MULTISPECIES: phosphate ABC transporter substrate-binding protein PstS [Desertifilum]MDA0213070.1 phosphate ABC transporter substrate-binding protein PstS [Cyanobacteria bacterium FC1]MBD2312364.1 phosphate ABC transporter substrate-binding protein PstS [Desertifilum sp. FACHB-1129]MBD2321147.1 phosphate ABC transporter substrate-binding protein PstS [Desertifilum sp. FACHB-866]MBD2331546.1 phosphate ABC transporter substrate-binding protein PstS [Desertifilum sp. FACHB-868]OEJ76058.1 phosp
MRLRLNSLNPTRLAATSLSAVALAFSVTACGPRTAETPTPGTATTQGGGSGQTVTLSGAGASFPAPLYQRWFAAYNQDVDRNVQVSYQSVGSGAGLEQYINGTVDFGASDAPIQGDRLKSFQDKYTAEPIQIPMAAGAVVLAYNLPGFDNLRLSREAYCGIVEGRVTRWNDPLIAQQNPGQNLPDQPITFAHRSDGSGTTFIFVNHIDAACPNWPAGVGTSVNWPTGVGGQGNEGVAAQIQQNEGTIGYIEYAYAKLNNIQMAELQNRSGNFIFPSAESAAATFEGVEIPEDFGLTVPDPENAQAFPIAGLTWIMIYPQYQDAAKWNTLQNVLTWALTDGRPIAEELGYIPMPDTIVQRIQQVMSEVQTQSQ